MRFMTHDTAIKAVKWCAVTIIFNCLVELAFGNHPILQAISYLLWLGGTWLVVSRHLSANPGRPGQSLEDVLLETACDRMCLIPDIDNVFYNTGYDWCWPDEQSITEIVVTSPDGKRWHGTVQMDSADRVYAVSVLIDGVKTRFVNKPYLYPKKEQMKVDNKPITSFLHEVLPDAVWSWAGDDLLSVTSADRELDNVLVKVHYRKDGTVSSMIGTEEKVRLVRSTKKSAGKSSTKAATATETTAEKTEAVREQKPAEKPAIAPKLIEDVERDGKKSVLTAPEREPAVADAVESIESDLLQVDELPPLSTETVKMAAENTAMFISGELEELANAAIDEGEDSFLYKWPEGIQTLVEAEYLAKELLSRCDIYKDITVDGDKKTLKIALLV